MKAIIKKENLIFVLLFIPFMLDINFLIPLTNPHGALVRRILLADSFLILFYYIKEIKKTSRITKCILTFCILVFIFTILKGNSLFVSLYYSGILSAFVILIDVTMKRDLNFFLSFITKVYGMILIITCFFQFAAPSLFGVAETSGNNYNFWVSDNEMGYVYIPLVVAIACKDYMKNRKLTLKTFIFIAISVISTILAWSGTCIIGMFIMCLGFVCAVCNIKYFNFKKIFIVAVMIALGILVFRIQDVFAPVIVGMLHKDLTFTGRVYAWDMALKMIKKNIFIGYGTINGGRLTIFDVWKNTEAVSAHSYILEIILQGGLIGFGAIVYAYIVAGKCLYQNRKTQISIFISISLFAMLIMYITEGWVYHTFQYIILYLAYYSWKITNNNVINR